MQGRQTQEQSIPTLCATVSNTTYVLPLAGSSLADEPPQALREERHCGCGGCKLQYSAWCWRRKSYSNKWLQHQPLEKCLRRSSAMCSDCISLRGYCTCWNLLENAWPTESTDVHCKLTGSDVNTLSLIKKRQKDQPQMRQNVNQLPIISFQL